MSRRLTPLGMEGQHGCQSGPKRRRCVVPDRISYDRETSIRGPAHADLGITGLREERGDDPVQARFQRVRLPPQEFKEALKSGLRNLVMGIADVRAVYSYDLHHHTC
eukprot:scaffold1068_cov375-Prasinococcus_capsulatus_cf.AAC.29